MTHREIPFHGFRALRCLKRPGQILENVPCYSLVLDSGTFLFPIGWTERGATISAARLHNGVLRFKASFPYDQKAFAPFGLTPAWLGDLVACSELVLTWSEGREDATFDEKIARVMSQGLLEQADQKARRIIYIARSAGLADLIDLTSEERRSFTGMYETSKALCRMMRNQTLWPVLTVAGLTDEDRADMEQVRGQLRNAYLSIYERDASARFLALPLQIGKAIVYTELSDVALLAEAELVPERRELYQTGYLFDRPQRAETPAQPGGTAPRPGGTAQPGAGTQPRPATPPASGTAPGTTPATPATPAMPATPATPGTPAVPARPAAPPIGTTPAPTLPADPRATGVVLPDGTTHWLPGPERPPAAAAPPPASPTAPAPAAPTPAPPATAPAPPATPATGAPPAKPKGRRPGRRGPISAARPRGR